MNILLAIDGSEFSQAATQALIAQAKPKETEVRVLHVIEPIVIAGESGFTVDWDAMTQELRKKGEGLLTQTAQALRTAGFQVATAMEEGSPKSIIIDLAAKWPADLVVMGCHDQHPQESASGFNTANSWNHDTEESNIGSECGRPANRMFNDSLAIPLA